MAITGIECFGKEVYPENYRVFEEIYYGARKRPGIEKDKHEKTSQHLADLPEDLFSHVKNYLIFGKLLGVIPISGVFSSSHVSLSFRYLLLIT